MELYLFAENKLSKAVLTTGVKDGAFVHLVAEVFDSGLIKGEKLYACMQELHQKLDFFDMKLLCNCFRYDVFPSRMALSMGHGTKAYKMVLGQPATELVDIFDSTEELSAIVSFENQKQFYEKWLNSLR